jgi:outer membrane protein
MPRIGVQMRRRIPFVRWSLSGKTVKALAIVSVAVTCVVAGAGRAGAETIGGALTKAYFNNPDINQQRAAVRASDENVPKAKAGYRPTINAEADAGLQDLDLQATGIGNKPPDNFSTRPRGFGVTVN